MPATIKDIAKHFGVGIATVSRAINGTGYVRDDLKKEILKYVESVDWQASSAAMALKTGKTKNVAFLINTLLCFYNATIIERAVYMLREKGFRSFLSIGIENEFRKEEIKSFIKNKLDTVVVLGMSSIEEEDIQKLEENKIRAVTLGRTAFSTSYVAPDYERVSYDAMTRLINSGHKKIAYIDGFAGKEYISSIKDLQTEQTRLSISGLMKAAKENNIDFKLSRDTIGDCEKGDKRLEEKLLEKKHTAYIGHRTDVLTALYSICSEHNIKIPDDVSVVGISGVEQFKAYSPAPVYYQPDFEEIARRTVEFIVSGKKTVNLNVPYNLIKGKSVRKI
jgi:DNA-binding LacI/PurR family transcriptional regulator